MRPFFEELTIYIGRFREFDRTDWIVYSAWVGLMTGLTSVTGGFIIFGLLHHVTFPPEAFFVPIGAAIFSVAISMDTIGHRTIYKEEISKGEGLVHWIIIFMGITSCVLLSVAYGYPVGLGVPAAVLTILSFAYSWIDEAIHWRRYLTQKSDMVEMWSHVFILIGHALMMYGWWRWFWLGYPGVQATFAALGLPISPPATS